MDSKSTQDILEDKLAPQAPLEAKARQEGPKVKQITKGKVKYVEDVLLATFLAGSLVSMIRFERHRVKEIRIKKEKAGQTSSAAAETQLPCQFCGKQRNRHIVLSSLSTAVQRRTHVPTVRTSVARPFWFLTAVDRSTEMIAVSPLTGAVNVPPTTPWPASAVTASAKPPGTGSPTLAQNEGKIYLVVGSAAATVGADLRTARSAITKFVNRTPANKPLTTRISSGLTNTPNANPPSPIKPIFTTIEWVTISAETRITEVRSLAQVITAKTSGTVCIIIKIKAGFVVPTTPTINRPPTTVIPGAAFVI